MTETAQLPGAASVLRRALLLWGSGHIALGDRRGWLLLALQPLAICAVALVALALIDGTRWLAVFVPVVVLLGVWLGQAIHAHRRAIALGAAPGGELQIAAFLPLALTALTLFWLVGGRHGSPAATVESYMAAWLDGRAEIAAGLFTAPRGAADVAAAWQTDAQAIAARIADGRAIYGAVSGLDPAQPFDSLRVSLLDSSGQSARFVVEIVRAERFETTFLAYQRPRSASCRWRRCSKSTLS